MTALSQFCQSHGLMMPMPDRDGCCWYCARDEAEAAPGSVVRVWTFSNNGMVMAVDAGGGQVPAYQGRLEDVAGRPTGRLARQVRLPRPGRCGLP